MNTTPSEKKSFSISVVIPNYNGRQLLEKNLPSVYTALKNVTAYEVIIVDDASTDDSVNYIKNNHPDIILLANEINKGFAATINKGIAIAKHDLVLALNSDVQLTSTYFESQYTYFSKSDTFGVMGRIIGFGNGELQDAAKFPKVNFKGIKTSYNYNPLNTSGVWLPSFFLSGANALMDRKKLLALNSFDELYSPFYYEDADLGLRAWRVGWKCYYEPQAVCMHELSSTISKTKPTKKKIIIERNRILFNYIHLQGIQLFAYKCWLRLRSVSRLIIGNTIALKAMKEVTLKQDALAQSKEKLVALQKKNNCCLSAKEVERIITKEIKIIKYKIF